MDILSSPRREGAEDWIPATSLGSELDSGEGIRWKDECLDCPSKEVVQLLDEVPVKKDTGKEG